MVQHYEGILGGSEQLGVRVNGLVHVNGLDLVAQVAEESPRLHSEVEEHRLSIVAGAGAGAVQVGRVLGRSGGGFASFRRGGASATDHLVELLHQFLKVLEFRRGLLDFLDLLVALLVDLELLHEELHGALEAGPGGEQLPSEQLAVSGGELVEGQRQVDVAHHVLVDGL